MYIVIPLDIIYFWNIYYINFDFKKGGGVKIESFLKL